MISPANQRDPQAPAADQERADEELKEQIEEQSVDERPTGPEGRDAEQPGSRDAQGGEAGYAFDIQVPDTDREEVGEGEVHVRSEGFWVYYGDNAAVCDVSFGIPKGQVTAIIGPSGCGKSTFLRAINRMNDLIPIAHTDGGLYFGDQDVYSEDVDVVELRKRVGMVFQKPNPFPKSIFDNVAYGPRIHGVKDKSTLDQLVEESLVKSALWDEVKDRMEDNALGLSGGQQQRLCLARALAVDPDILLMDEPTSALDPKSTASIENLIGELRGNYTIIIVTHNMQQAARVSDRTAFLYEGYLIEYGETEQLFTRPREKQTEDYVTGRFG